MDANRWSIINVKHFQKNKGVISIKKEEVQLDTSYKD